MSIRELMIIIQQVILMLKKKFYHFRNFIVAWFRHNATPKEKANLIKYLQKEGDPERGINWDLIRLVHSSVANTSILLFQDVLSLEEGCQMNDPYVEIIEFLLYSNYEISFLFRSFPPSYEKNWRWRFKWEQLTQETKDKLKELTNIYGRYVAEDLPEKSPETICDKTADEDDT